MVLLDSLLSGFKDFATTRGFNYHYYLCTSSVGKPTLLLVHGFPSLAVDWHNQINYFKERGYGLIVPDQLGYGGSDKPAEVAAYTHSSLAKDLIEILDHEKATDVVAIGHDWGSKTTSLLANLYADRFLGFGFLAVGYLPPNAKPLPETVLDQMVGYWKFFTAPDATNVIKEHIESFYDLLYAKDARLWRFNLSPAGATRIFIEADARAPRVSFANESDEMWTFYRQQFEKNGFEGPLNYYKVASSEIDSEDAKKIPLENYKIQKPVFLGNDGVEDALGAPHIQEAQTRGFCPNATVVNFSTTHWVQAEAPEAVNEALEKWITTAVLA
ncbi:alpha/beta-hydrolase [Coprinellus micaceus]|uniref:Alpha/beta-hydrolase n=1 Tax=Coprinellus micaceus TaxID=71717 RepID=A0A4Y7TZP3_COPMI|nr:alpha/beta-hydrolase [Coprinellus micaceus]